MLYVVGSGPAGVSCAHALLEKGCEVTMLDAGIVLESEKQKLLKVMQKSKKWPAKLVQKIKCKLDMSAKDGPYKLSYGSDYPYREVQDELMLSFDGALCRPSFAKGGLSNVWGAAILPYLEEDIEGWPISVADLAPHYRKVLSFMNLAGAHDELEERFPLYTDSPQKLNPSAQASLLLEHFRKNKKKLYGEGFRFGASRLAVQSLSGNGKNGCVYCGLCLYGCPNRLIYSSAFTLEELKKNERFSYVPNVVIERLEEFSEGVTVIAHDRRTKEKQNFAAERVFLGCGAVPTAKIVLASLEAHDTSVALKDSQQFLIPCFTYRGINRVTNEKLHTLCQLYVEILDKRVDPKHVHLQVYTYNDVFEQWLKGKFKIVYTIFKVPFRLLMGRIIVLKAFLHSDSSGKLLLKLEKDSSKITIKGSSSHSRGRLFGIVMKLVRNTFALGMFPLFPLAKCSKPGGANHYGSSFPMQKEPKGFESDVLGRPAGFARVHVVDSSVLPSIASQTVTLIVMANAHRIATQAVSEHEIDA